MSKLTKSPEKTMFRLEVCPPTCTFRLLHLCCSWLLYLAFAGQKAIFVLMMYNICYV